MVVYLRSGAKLRARLKPDIDQYTREVRVEDGLSLGEILQQVGVPVSLVAFALVRGKLRRFDYRPSDGEVITLQPPVWGG